MRVRAFLGRLRRRTGHRHAGRARPRLESRAFVGGGLGLGDPDRPVCELGRPMVRPNRRRGI